jgi:hypothetical protein
LLGHLAPLSIVTLNDGRFMVFVFPTVKWDFEPSGPIFDTNLFVPEGAIGRVFEPKAQG